MKNFKQYITEFDAPNIYCDMDGVLADFTSFTTKYLGKAFTDEDWLKLPKDMFYQLPPMRCETSLGIYWKTRSSTIHSNSST